MQKKNTGISVLVLVYLSEGGHIVQTMTLTEFHAAIAAQGVSSREHVAFICPVCGTIQSGADLIATGGGKNFDEIECALGFSCVGRLTDAGPWPALGDTSRKAKARREQPGCDWTLGGLFQIHRLEVITPDGCRHPLFELASPEVAQSHMRLAGHPCPAAA